MDGSPWDLVALIEDIRDERDEAEADVDKEVWAEEVADPLFPIDWMAKMNLFFFFKFF